MGTYNIVFSVILYTYFATTVILDSYVLIKVRFSLDPSMYFILAANMISLFTKLPLFTGEGLNLGSGMSTTAFYGLFYYFIFEMLRLKIKLESNNHEEHMMAKRRHFFK